MAILDVGVNRCSNIDDSESFGILKYPKTVGTQQWEGWDFEARRRASPTLFKPNLISLYSISNYFGQKFNLINIQPEISLQFLNSFHQHLSDHPKHLGPTAVANKIIQIFNTWKVKGKLEYAFDEYIYKSWEVLFTVMHSNYQREKLVSRKTTNTVFPEYNGTAQFSRAVQC